MVIWTNLELVYYLIPIQQSNQQDPLVHSVRVMNKGNLQSSRLSLILIFVHPQVGMRTL
jgi:hypothetical protein